MNKKEFGLALNALLPHCDPNAPQKWAEFAARCVNHELFVYVIPTEYHAAVEKWLDNFYAGLYAVKQEYGEEIATQMAGLPCQRCDLFPGQMMNAAEILKDGGTAEELRKMDSDGTLKLAEPHFFDLPDEAALTVQGPELGVLHCGVICGSALRRTDPGYVLVDGSVLLGCERDSFGRWRCGNGMTGTYLETGQLYAPVRHADGIVRTFQEVRPVMAREREAAYLADKGDSFAIYRPKDMNQADMEGLEPLIRLRQSGTSPLDENYNLIHVVQLEPGADQHSRLNACRSVNTLRPGDIAVFKQDGALTCWYVELMGSVKLMGVLENCLKAAEQSVEQNANQIDGIINNEAPRSSLRDNLKQCQQKAGASKPADAPNRPSQGQDR